MRLSSSWFAMASACLLVAGLPAAAEPEEPAEPEDVVEARIDELLPPDAADYAKNYRLCLHWEGEEAYDAERAHEIEQGLTASCTGLDSIRAVLRSKYPPGSRADSTLRRIVADIDSLTERFVWEDPRRESRVLDRYWEAAAGRRPRRVDELIAQRAALADTAHLSIRQMIAWQTQVETRYLGETLANADRLRPETAARLRAAIQRWERETGEKVPRTP